MVNLKLSCANSSLKSEQRKWKNLTQTEANGSALHINMSTTNVMKTTYPHNTCTITRKKDWDLILPIIAEKNSENLFHPTNTTFAKIFFSVAIKKVVTVLL